MILTVLVILVVGFATRSIGEHRVAYKERDSIQALYLAEAGLDRAISELPNTPLSDTLGAGSYYAETSTISGTQFLITSKGGIPDIDETNPDNIIRKIITIVEQPLVIGGDPSGVTAAIAASGDIVVQGAAEVNGDIDDNTTFDFEETFGITKQTMKDSSSNLYTDPANNITPVNAISWVDIETADEMLISDSTWEGSGILVVNGNLKITGGHFVGVIWVIGELRISGNPIIDGSIFVEGGTEFTTTITGTPIVNYDSDAISDAFGSGSSPYIINWKEE